MAEEAKDKLETVEKESVMAVAANIDVVDTEVKKVKEVSDAVVSDKKKFFYTKKVCKFCTKQQDEKALDYKNIDLLRRFVMPSGKILPRRISGNCAKHQRHMVREVKKARIIALLPFMDR